MVYFERSPHAAAGLAERNAAAHSENINNSIIHIGENDLSPSLYTYGAFRALHRWSPESKLGFCVNPKTNFQTVRSNRP